MFKILKAFFLVTSIHVAAPLVMQAQVSQENLIHREIVGLHNDKGQVLCALYSSADGFPKRPDKAVAHTKSDISHGHALCEFPGINSGTYAASVFHDENSNGKLDTNFIGMPREGVGGRTTQRVISGPRNSTTPLFIFQAVG